jgi:hypothetical protein
MFLLPFVGVVDVEDVISSPHFVQNLEPEFIVPQDWHLSPDIEVVFGEFVFAVPESVTLKRELVEVFVSTIQIIRNRIYWIKQKIVGFEGIRSRKTTVSACDNAMFLPVVFGEFVVVVVLLNGLGDSTLAFGFI